MVAGSEKNLAGIVHVAKTGVLDKRHAGQAVGAVDGPGAVPAFAAIGRVFKQVGAGLVIERLVGKYGADGVRAGSDFVGVIDAVTVGVGEQGIGPKLQFNVIVEAVPVVVVVDHVQVAVAVCVDVVRGHGLP